MQVLPVLTGTAPWEPEDVFLQRRRFRGFAEILQTDVWDQIEAAKGRVSNKTGSDEACNYIAYFQSFTNTYAPVFYLKPLFERAISHPDIAALSIATRPDCWG